MRFPLWLIWGVLAVMLSIAFTSFLMHGGDKAIFGDDILPVSPDELNWLNQDGRG